MRLSRPTFQKTLLVWFDKHGRKQLPWQQNKTPYRVWISEIMLQQTQVNTVIPYFERFMQCFPDLTSLAQAPEDAVLHLWAGLGYYNRARNLQRAAIIVMEKYAGIFPDTNQALLSLPGIGPSTAGAILAIAFNQPATILDGNVKRVLARLHGITDPINDKTTENHLWQLAIRYTPKQRVADYTQAIMDLGATLCTRAKPTCEHCPFITHCNAYQQNIVNELPAKKSAQKIPTRSTTFLIFQQNNRILLHKRPSTGIWGGLYCLPEITGTPTQEAIRIFCQQHFSFTLSSYQSLEPFRHTFSHYHLRIFPVLLPIKAGTVRIMENTQQIWYNLHHPEPVGLPKPVQSILRGLT